MTLIAQFADHLARPVATAMRRRAALHVMDWAGCAVIGATAPVARSLAGVFLSDRDGPCAVIGHSGGADAEAAARFNGALGNIHEMDDVDKRARLHPGPVIIPAALALVQSLDASPQALLDGIVRGYEAAIRLGRALGDGHYRFWHPTSTAGMVGAAAACASILGLDRDGMAQAMALAITRTGGLWETRNDPLSHAKQIHNGMAAADGLMAARLAATGLRGPARILEGSEGLFAATAADAVPASLLAGVSPAGWCITDVSLKPWPACRHAHPVIDAALAVLEKAGRARLEAHAIAGVAVQTYGDALRFCDRPSPRNVIEAKFSLQHAAAVTLLNGPPPLSAFDPPVIDDPTIAALRAHVKVAAGEPYASAYPLRFGARLVVNLSNGDLLVHEQADALGDPENPLPIEQAIAKARALMAAAGMDETAASRLIGECLELAEASSLPTAWRHPLERAVA